MRKLYAKFTKDRIEKFQIETYIAREDDKQYVAKRALHPEAVNHIARMKQYFDERVALGILCPSDSQKTGTICFDFIEGKSLCKEMLEALDREDETGLLSLFSEYRRILELVAERVEEVDCGDEEFEEIFGAWSYTAPIKCARNLDIDLTFDNLIHEASSDSYKVIDYEWFFSCPVPLNYVVYRAVWAFHFKYASAMKGLVTLEQMLDSFGITKEQIAWFDQMNQHFDAYVYGAPGMHQVYEGYKKETILVKKLLPEENLFLQTFVSDGVEYREEWSKTYHLDGKNISFMLLVNVKPNYILRIDPLNVSCVIKNLELKVIYADGTMEDVTGYEHNAIIASDAYTFLSEDPQILIKNTKDQEIVMVRIVFEIAQAGMLELPIRATMEGLQYQMLDMQKEMIRLEAEKKKLSDELVLIKDSKVYQSLMAKKIDKLMGDIYS